MGMNTIEELKERVILIGVSTSDGDDTEESLKELKELADTAGAETVGTVIQNRESIRAPTSEKEKSRKSGPWPLALTPPA